MILDSFYQLFNESEELDMVKVEKILYSTYSKLNKSRKLKEYTRAISADPNRIKTVILTAEKIIDDVRRQTGFIK